MPATRLERGPFPRSEIDKRVKLGPSIGVYVWGVIDDDGDLRVRYVGRSDSNQKGLNGRLHDYDGDDYAGWTHFKFDYFPDERAAFERESEIWHDFNLANRGQIHPRRPDGATYPCPRSKECFPPPPKKKQ